MPPRRGRSAASAPATTPALEGCRVALSGTFPDASHADLQKQVVALGGSTSSAVAKDTTHLISIWADYNKPSAKVKAAKAQNIPIVTAQWLQDSAASQSKEDESKYLPTTPPSSADSAAPADPPASADPPSPASAPRKVAAPRKAASRKAPAPAKSQAKSEPKTNRSKKRAASPAPSAAAAPSPSRAPSPSPAPSPPQTKPKAKPRAGRARKRAASPAASVRDPSSAPPVQKKKKADEDDKAEEADKPAKGGKVKVPVDSPRLAHAGWTVYIDPAGVIYDASLNQTNATNNNNKFYRIQLLELSGASAKSYMTWTRWGRVGDTGQVGESGSGTYDRAVSTFNKKFKDKSGLRWENRFDTPPAGKYTFVERSYDDDDDGEDGGDEVEIKCTLDPTVQDLMRLIFNQRYFVATMTALNYDPEKLPLGKLSQNTINRGYETLNDLAALLDDPALAADYGTGYDTAVENLSNAYYSLIPHAFGRQRPPVLNSQPKVKTEIELLDNLGDMKDAAQIMKPQKTTNGQDPVHPLDRQFQGLGMSEMSPLDPAGHEFNQLSAYLNHTRGTTHNLQYRVEAIFRIERNGERDRFDKSPFASASNRNRRLLWHGSRSTNFGGILSQGLRIAPPEAPASGYMFGKGIYLADMSSKSANYCCASLSGNTALLLLCEAELGEPMLELLGAQYDADKKAKRDGRFATWGKGRTGPADWVDGESIHPSLKGVQVPDLTKGCQPSNVSGASLLYNEYICYDVSQVRLRYLLRVKI